MNAAVEFQAACCVCVATAQVEAMRPVLGLGLDIKGERGQARGAVRVVWPDTDCSKLSLKMRQRARRAQSSATAGEAMTTRSKKSTNNYHFRLTAPAPNNSSFSGGAVATCRSKYLTALTVASVVENRSRCSSHEIHGTGLQLGRLRPVAPTFPYRCEFAARYWSERAPNRAPRPQPKRAGYAGRA